VTPAAQHLLEAVRRDHGLPALHRTPQLDWVACEALKRPFGQTTRLLRGVGLPHRVGLVWRGLGPVHPETFVRRTLGHEARIVLGPQWRRYGLAFQPVWPGLAFWSVILLDDLPLSAK